MYGVRIVGPMRIVAERSSSKSEPDPLLQFVFNLPRRREVHCQAFEPCGCQWGPLDSQAVVSIPSPVGNRLWLQRRACRCPSASCAHPLWAPISGTIMRDIACFHTFYTHLMPRLSRTIPEPHLAHLRYTYFLVLLYFASTLLMTPQLLHGAERATALTTCSTRPSPT